MEGWIRTERDLNSSMGRDGIILVCIDTLTGCSSAFMRFFRLAAHALHEDYHIVSFIYTFLILCIRKLNVRFVSSSLSIFPNWLVGFH